MTDQRCCQPFDVAAVALPLVVIASLCLCYATAPDFYLQWVLEEQHREYQLVEIVTVLSGFLATVLMARTALRLRRDPAQRGEGLFGDRGGAKIVGVVGLATFFFVGEEISWGQTYFLWDTPDNVIKYSVETNLHNVRGPISVQGLGSAFLLVVFVGLPLLWHKKNDVLPASWAPAIPRWPISFAMLAAFGWKGFKQLYRALGYYDKDDKSQFYVEFIDQINEQKELLVALALLLYALSLGCEGEQSAEE